jgi:hypothetical protein
MAEKSFRATRTGTLGMISDSNFDGPSTAGSNVSEHFIARHCASHYVFSGIMASHHSCPHFGRIVGNPESGISE